MSRSRTESEYKAIANATQELLWLWFFLQELGFMSSSTPINCDNIGAIYLTSNPIFHAGIKHIGLNFHFVREQVAKVHFVHSPMQLADLFTKPLPITKFQHLCSQLPLRDAHGLAGWC